MTFFYLLKENGFNLEDTKEIFYGLTDPQIYLINILASEHARMAEDEANKASSKNRGKTGTETYKKHFDLRG